MGLIADLFATACRAVGASYCRRVGRLVLLLVACGFGAAQALTGYSSTCGTSLCHQGPPPNAYLGIIEKGGNAESVDALKALVNGKSQMNGVTSIADVDWAGILNYLHGLRNGQLAPAGVAFGDHRINSSATADVTVTNNRSEEVALGITGTPDGFSLSLASTGCLNMSGNIPAESSCTLKLTFTPTAVQSYSGTFNVYLTGSQSPVSALTLAVSGAGTAPHLSVAPGIILASKVNEAATGLLLLSNTGSDPLVISAFGKGPSGDPSTSRPANYSVVDAAPASNRCAWPPPFTVAAGSACTVGAKYAPPAITPPARPTQTSATLTITSDSDSTSGATVSTGVDARWAGTPVPVPGVSLSLGTDRLFDFSPVVNELSTNEVLLGDVVTRQFTVTNTGAPTSRLLIRRFDLANTAEGDFAVADDCTGPMSRELVAGGPANLCTVTLTFAPQPPAARRSAALTIVPSFPEIEENDPTAASPAVAEVLTLSGYGYLPLSLGPPPPLLRHAVRGIYRPTRIVLANTGVQPLLVSGLQLAGTGFTMTDNCPRAPAALPPPPDPGPSTSAATQCAIDVTFDPSAVGSYAATLTVTSNAPGSPHQLVMSGVGTATTPPVLEWQGPAGVIDHGTVAPGATSDPPRVLRLYNHGPGRVEVSLLNAIGERAGEFGLTPSTTTGACPAYVPGQPTLPLLIYDNEYCDILATFSPTAPGLRQATVQVVSSGTNPATLSLQGTGAPVPAAPLEASATLLLFSGVQQGSHSAPQLLVLRNNTAATMRVTQVVVGAGFNASGGGCAAVPFELAAGAVCTMSVQFTPAATGTTTAMLSVYSEGRAEPLQVRLEGAAVAQPDASGGGCSLSDGRSPFDPVLWLSAIAACGVLWRRRRQSARDAAAAAAAAAAGMEPRVRDR